MHAAAAIGDSLIASSSILNEPRRGRLLASDAMNPNTKVHAFALVISLIGACAHNKAPPKSAAKLTADQATSIALAQAAGEVKEVELEQEDGRLIYSVEIRPTGQTGRIKEINVDAIDGSIVNTEEEEDDDDDDDDKDDRDDD
jgi:hypothetical protein